MMGHRWRLTGDWEFEDGEGNSVDLYLRNNPFCFAQFHYGPQNGFMFKSLAVSAAEIFARVAAEKQETT